MDQVAPEVGRDRPQVSCQHLGLSLAHAVRRGAVNPGHIAGTQDIGVDQQKLPCPQPHELLRDRRAGAAHAHHGDFQLPYGPLDRFSESPHAAVEYARFEMPPPGIESVAEPPPVADEPEAVDRLAGRVGLLQCAGQRQSIAGRRNDDGAKVDRPATQPEYVSQGGFDPCVLAARQRRSGGVGVEPHRN